MRTIRVHTILLHDDGSGVEVKANDKNIGQNVETTNTVQDVLVFKRHTLGHLHQNERQDKVRYGRIHFFFLG